MSSGLSVVVELVVTRWRRGENLGEWFLECFGFFLDSDDMIFKKSQFLIFLLNVAGVAWLGGHATSTV
jgi:hypothetical protein